MALMICKDCGKEISTSANSCPNCGAKPAKNRKIILIVLSIPLLLVFFGVVSSMFTPQYEKDALEKKRICKQIAPPHMLSECERIYQQDLAFGSSVTGKCESLLDLKKRAMRSDNKVGAEAYDKEYRECLSGNK